jgi:hypothetical protein
MGAPEDVAKIDGYVIYEVADGNEEFPNMYLRQPFAKAGNFEVGGVKDDFHNVWAWNGNREAPSLTPSFLAEWTRSFSNIAYVVHIYLTDGKIVNSGSTNIEL